MFDQIFDAIELWMRDLLTGMINSNLQEMFTDVNQKTGEIATQVGMTPQGWNSSIFNMIQGLSNSVILPIAGIIITFVLCYELISMLTEKNNMHDIDTWMFFKYFVKMWIAVFLVSNTFTITMAVFDVGQYVVNAPCLKEVLLHMVDWLGNREYKVYAWSDSDYSQLQHEILCKEIADARIDKFMDSERWIDYQAEFGRRFEFSRAISLEEAMMYCDIDAEGRLHDGLDDAANTAKLIKTLELNKDFILCQCDIDYKTDSEPLNFCMGDLFAGLNLNCMA